MWLALRSVGVVADVGTTYNSSQTYQHLVAHNPDVRSVPPPTLLSPYVYLPDNIQRYRVGEERGGACYGLFASPVRAVASKPLALTDPSQAAGWRES